MPVVINAESGLAEDLPDPLATKALQEGTHHVALNDPDGNPVTAPYHEAAGLLRANYTQPTPEQLSNLLRFAKFSSPIEQAKTFAEGIGQGTTFGASTAGELAAGAKAEDIAARRATNPGVHELGQMTGLIGSSLTGVGEAAVLGHAGDLAAKGLGLAGEGLAKKIGSAAVKEAIAFSGIQAGDEVSKMILGQSDPSAPVETALMHIGLSGLIGAGAGTIFGSIPPLWESANKTKLGQYLQAMRDRSRAAEGLRSDLPYTEYPSMPNEVRVDELARKAGIEVSPVMRAALSTTPEWGEKFRTLIESATGSGKEAQAALRDFVQSIHDKTIEALGITPEDVGSIKNVSDNDLGLAMMNGMAKDVDMDMHPLAEQFKKIKETYKDLPLGEASKRDLVEKIAALALDQGYNLEGTPENRLLQNLMTKWIPKAETVQDLRPIYTTLGRQTEDPKLWKIGGELADIIDKKEMDIVERQLAKDQPEKVGENQRAREKYSFLMEDLRRVSQRLHPGTFAGPDSFLTQMSKMKPEDVLRRLTPVGDANLLELAKGRFPSLVPEMQKGYMNTLVRAAAKEARDPFVVQPYRLFDVVSKWSPELKKFALPPGGEERLMAAKELSKLNPYMRNSLTAKNLDSMWSKVPGATMAMLSMAEGKNPAWGYLMGEGARLVAREAPDAMTLATLKLLGDAKPIEPSAFKTAVEFIHATFQGENLLGKAVKNIFKTGAEVLPQRLYPTPKMREKMKKRLAELDLDTSSLMKVGGNTGYYLPEQGMALGQVAGRVSSVLGGLRPSERKMGILSPQRRPSAAEHAAFDNALTLAEQPLVALDRIQKGTLTTRDVELVKQFYPSLYDRMSQKLMDEVISHVSEGEMVPYSMRLALSRFLGQPMDASMNAETVLASQPKPMGPLTSPPKKKSGGLSQFAAQYQTPLQSRQRARTSAGTS